MIFEGTHGASTRTCSSAMRPSAYTKSSPSMTPLKIVPVMRQRAILRISGMCERSAFGATVNCSSTAAAEARNCQTRNSKPMKMMQEFDFCVLGGGSAGFAGATTARSLGKSVAVVDGTGPLAGLCILRGCMPSKTLLRSAEIAHLVRRAPDLGIEAGQPSVNFANVMARKRRIIKEFTDHRVEGIEKFPLFRGDAKFVSGTELHVGDIRIRVKKYLIATGSIINIPEIPGLAESGYVTSD